ncbi:DUF4158 domain-containing protein [Paraglaciecola sp. Hal342]
MKACCGQSWNTQTTKNLITIRRLLLHNNASVREDLSRWPLSIRQLIHELNLISLEDELGDVYTPTSEDKKFALRHCKRASASLLGLLVQLKITQRLGRFVNLGEIPKGDHHALKNQCRSRVALKNLKPITHLAQRIVT